MICVDQPVAVERIAQRVDHPPEQGVSHRDIHDPACAFHFVAGVKVLIIAEQDDSDFVLIHVECDAEQIAREPHQFFKPYAGKT